MKLTYVALAVTIVASSAGSLRGQTVRLPVTRDTWLSAVGREADGSNGGAPRLKLKSIQEMSIVDLDPRPLRGRVVRDAALHLRGAGEPRLKRVTVSSVAGDWFEGTATNYLLASWANVFDPSAGGREWVSF